MILGVYKDKMDYAKGAIFGAFIGDAAGASLEFLGREPTAFEVTQAQQMSGGGILETAPGQITDDSEMAIALCRSLIGEDAYSPLQVARNYRRWYLTDPFDCGNATSSALYEGDLHSPDLADQVMRNALEYNLNSKANGSLMRVAPLGVWAARVDSDVAIEAAHLDARLTHPSPTCRWSTAAYVVAIRHLVLNTGDHLGAFATAESILITDDSEEVLGWPHDAKAGRLPPFSLSIGFVRIAFTHAFHHLYRATTYLEALQSVLFGGGDTDTNACIVGGLIGALHGFNSVPETMRASLLNCDVSLGQPRPKWLQTRKLDKLIEQLCSDRDNHAWP